MTESGWSMPIIVSWKGKIIGYASNYDEADRMIDFYRETVVEPFMWKPVYVDVTIRLPRWLAERLTKWGWIKEN